jgi:hypothetical protein
MLEEGLAISITVLIALSLLSIGDSNSKGFPGINITYVHRWKPGG